MPIAVPAASGTITRIFSRDMVPPLPHRLLRVCTRVTAPAVLAITSTTSTRLQALCAMTATQRLVGATLLNALQRRTTCQFLKKPSSTAVIGVPMIEPFGTLIRAICTDLLKTGFIQIHDNESAMTFTDGTNKIEFTVTDRHYHPALTGYLITRNGAYFSLASLRDKFNSAATKKTEMEAYHAINIKYGLWEHTTPQASRDAGFRAALSLQLNQTVTFLSTHKTTLAALGTENEWD